MHTSQGTVTRLLIAVLIALFTIPAFGETPISDPVITRGASWQTAPDSATDGRDFLLVWADSRSGRSAIYATRVAADGSVLDPEGILVSNAAEGALRPTVAWTGDSYIVVWEEQDGCRFRRIATDGRIDGIGRVLDGQCLSPRAAALNGTTIVAAFLWHGVLAAGVIERTGAVRRINPVQGGGWFDIACTRSECRWVWNSNGRVMGRRLGPNGETLSNDLVLATDAMGPSIAATEDRFLLTWRDPSAFGVPSRRIWARELDAEAEFEPFIVAQTTKSAFLDARVSRSGRGFMVAWIQERGDAPVDHRSGVRSDDVADHTAYMPPPDAQFEIRAQRIGDGEEGQLLVAHSNVALDQPPSIASNGVTHIGAWIERNSRKIAAAILDDGERSRIVVTRTAAAQSEPHVVNCGDHLLVVWAEERNGKHAILARRFQLSGEALDLRPIDIASATESQHRPVAAFDGNSYLVAWYEGSGVFARRIHRDFTLAADVLALSGNGRGEPPAVVGTDRGFAVLHGDGPQLILTRIGAGSSLERTVIAERHGFYALGWTGSELVAVWSGYDNRLHNRVQAARMTSDGARLGPDILVGFGNGSTESLSIACGATECIAAWSPFWEDIQTASIANGQAFLVFETIPEPPYYRAQSEDRYRPTVVRTAGEFKVITYGPDGTLYMRSVRDLVVSAESVLSEPSVEAGDYAIAATGEGLVTVYSRPVSGPGYGGSRRLYLRSSHEQ